MKISKLICLILITVFIGACSSPHTVIRGTNNEAILRFIVEPDSAHIFIDGRDRGEAEDFEDEETPLIVSGGLHVVEIKKDGYKTFKQERYLGGGSVYEIRESLEKTNK